MDMKYMSCLNKQIDRVFEYNTVALFHDVSLVKNPVHSYIEDVIEYYEDKIDLNKIYAMHYQDDIDIETLEKQYGVNFVRPRKVYEF
jgi:metal-dependent hydrolase (beta-lactamase superfamily II)